jgi:hypothetical protein
LEFLTRVKSSNISLRVSRNRLEAVHLLEKRVARQLDEGSNFLRTQREDITHLFDSALDIEIISFYGTMPVQSLEKVRIKHNV